MLKRLGDYLSDRSATGDDPEIALGTVVARGEKRLRRQRWFSAAAGAGGMLVFVMVASFAFNTGESGVPDVAEPPAALSPTAPDTGSNATLAPTTTAFGSFAESSQGAALDSGRGFAVTDTSAVFGGSSADQINLDASTVLDQPVDIAWQSAPGPLGWSQSILASDGLFYVLSTAPGVNYDDYDGAQLPQAIYVSSDGLTWDATELGDTYISDLAVSGNMLYSVSTAPAAADSTLRIGRSDDGGATWSFSDQSLTNAPPTSIGRVQGVNSDAAIAAGDAGVVAVMSTSYFVDYWSVIPIELHDRTKERWPEATTDGVVLRDYSYRMEAEQACEAAMQEIGHQNLESEDDYPPECTVLWDEEPDGEIIYSVSWAELGLSGNPSASSDLFYSSDGVSFERVDSPFASQGFFTAFEAIDDGFLAIQQDWQTGQWTVWTSANGRDWARPSTLPATGWISTAGAIPSGVAIVSEAPSDRGSISVVTVSTDGGVTWRSIGIPDESGDEIEQYSPGAAVGSAGTVIARTSWTYDETSEGEGSQNTVLYLTTDYTTWSVIDLSEVVDATQYEIIGLGISGDRLRFDVIDWSNEGSKVTSHVGVIGG